MHDCHSRALAGVAHVVHLSREVVLRIRVFVRAAYVLALILIPTAVFAQSFTGTVKDSSGAVLPGVTVEAASPALIEKVKTAVTAAPCREERSTRRRL